MKSLFKEEEKNEAIKKMKFDLITRFYPFSKEQLIECYSLVNFDMYHLMNNEQIKWDKELVKKYENKLDFGYIYKIKNISIDFDFLNNYKDKIDFHLIHLSSSINWSNEIIDKFGDDFKLEKPFMTVNVYKNVEHLRRFHDRINWSYASKFMPLVNDENVINEFNENLDWIELSSNPYLPLSVEFIQKYIDKLDFDRLSSNPQSLDLIFKYPKSTKWNWEIAITNPGITYDSNNFQFFFHYFKKEYELKHGNKPLSENFMLRLFLWRVLKSNAKGLDFFLKDDFLELLDKIEFGVNSSVNLTPEFITKYKDKIDFKNYNTLRNCKDLITSDFLKENLNLFDWKSSGFYSLPITIEIFEKVDENLKYFKLSLFSRNFNWSEKFIRENYEKLNFFQLSENIGVYRSLINEKKVPEFLNEVYKNSN